ncbi:hypothetical protein BDA99DRAFT_441145 [Phascolomyces articulosus]|uniref:Uncharacterized protein n=1 Tax=Phascolomyces articulosus TaxID=60185 RepID=A0AAD5PCR7_9FUNG|nr:hypothetical protein BDA99DRAFT_441145 [Phascolomyces articulosus]
MDPTIEQSDPTLPDPKAAAFSIMFVSVGFSCFIWQSIRSGWMFYKIRKPIHGVVFFQALLGAVLTFVTLLTSLVSINCKFTLFFSVIAVNTGDICLQSVLLWKAFLGNNRSKVILGIGILPLMGLVVFIVANITVAQSSSQLSANVCNTNYPTMIVIIKAALDFSSNTFLSLCFILVIYRHYRVLVLGGSSPILYTIDWYLASYLIIKQLKYGRKEEGEEDEGEEDEDSYPEIDDAYNSNNNKHINSQLSQQPTLTTPRHHSDQFTMVDHSQPTLLEKPISLLLKNNDTKLKDDHQEDEDDGDEERENY